MRKCTVCVQGIANVLLPKNARECLKRCRLSIKKEEGVIITRSAGKKFALEESYASKCQVSSMIC